MKKTCMTACVAFGMVSGAFAIDRDMRMIDTIGLETAKFKDMTYVGLSLQVENLLAAPSEKWGVLAGLTAGRYDADIGPRIDSWSLSVGIRHYMTPVTTLSLTGSWRNDDADAFKVAAGTIGLRQRLLPVSFSISPWAEGRISVQDASLSGGFLSDRDRSFTAVVSQIDVGCDFLMSRQFAFVFQVGLSEISTVQSGVQYAEGFTAGLAMRYFWP